MFSVTSYYLVDWKADGNINWFRRGPCVIVRLITTSACSNHTRVWQADKSTCASNRSNCEFLQITSWMSRKYSSLNMRIGTVFLIKWLVFYCETRNFSFYQIARTRLSCLFCKLILWKCFSFQIQLEKRCKFYGVLNYRLIWRRFLIGNFCTTWLPDVSK